MQVRHQSLQIILTMAPHSAWIKSHLVLISEALENALRDDVPSIRHRAARCLDIIANSINTHLLAQSINSDAEFENNIEKSLLFWTKMLQSITEQLQDVEQNSAMKATFCDVFSNIGVHIYERLPVCICNFILIHFTFYSFILCLKMSIFRLLSITLD